VSAEVWFMRQGGALLPTDDESRAVIEGMSDDECQCFELVGVRDPVSFKKYWVMCTLISKHVRQIKIDRIRVDGRWQPVYKRIFDREDVSNAIKLGTGLYLEHPVGSTDYAIREVRSISYKKMNPAQWSEYVKRVAPFVQKKVLPDVRDRLAQDDLIKMLSKWLREIENEGLKERAA
jgi:hypothetical protein